MDALHGKRAERGEGGKGGDEWKWGYGEEMREDEVIGLFGLPEGDRINIPFII